MKQLTQILTVSEAARVLGIAPKTARVWADRGRLPVVRTEAGWRLFWRRDVERLAERRRREAAQ